MKKISKVLALFLVMVLMVAQVGMATTTRTSDKVNLKVLFFKGGYGDSWFQWLKAEYEKTHPNVTVQLQGDANLDQTITAKIEGGSDAPDVFFANGGNNDWKKWGPMGLLLELTDVYNSKVDGTKSTFKNYIAKSAAAGYAYNPMKKGIKYYSVPWAMDTFGIVYNAKMFKEHGWVYPKTWKDFTILCNKIKAAGIAPLTYPGIYPNYARGLVRAWTYQSLGEAKYSKYLNPTSVDIYNDVSLITVWNKWQSLFKNGWILNGSTALNHTQVQMEFINNKAAMILNGGWLENEMKDAWPKGYDIRMAPTPADGASSQPVAFQYGSDYGAIYAKTACPKEAKDFLLFSSSPVACQKFTELTGSFRPYNYDISKIKLSNFEKSCFDTMSGKNCTVINEVSSNPLLFKNIGTDYLSGIATGSMNPQDAFHKFFKDAVTYTDKRKRDLGLK